MKLGLTDVGFIIDLKRIPDLSYVRRENDTLAIGALTTHGEVASSQIIKDTIPLLAETAERIAHTQIRNRGTIGGSLCHCDPSADLPPTMLTLGAAMVLQCGSGQERTVSAVDFFKGMFESDVRKGELLREVRIPVPEKGSGYSFQKLTMPMGGFALVTVSVLLKMQYGVCKGLALSIGGVGEKPFRAIRTEEYLLGKEIANSESNVIRDAAELTVEGVELLEGMQYPEDFVTRMVKVTTRRALISAFERAV